MQTAARFVLAVFAVVVLCVACFGMAHACETSWYGAESGNYTANGERFNKSTHGELTAASLQYPMGTIIHVTNLSNGRAVDIRVNDRGPARWTGRCLDVNPAARDALGMGGTAQVRISAGGYVARAERTLQKPVSLGEDYLGSLVHAVTGYPTVKHNAVVRARYTRKGWARHAGRPTYAYRRRSAGRGHR